MPAMERSGALFSRALDCIPGGVNSPVRAFRSVGGTPAFFREAHGSRVIDEDGNTFIDYVGSWGSMILGHSHPAVVTAIKEQVDRGLSFGAPTEDRAAAGRMPVQPCTRHGQRTHGQLRHRGGHVGGTPCARLHRP